MSRIRRTFSPEFKKQVVQEVLSGQSQAQVARRYSLAPHMVQAWKKAFQTGRLGGEATGDADSKAKDARIAHLEQLLGRKESEIDFLKKTQVLLQQRRNEPVSGVGPSSSRRRKKDAS